MLVLFCLWSPEAWSALLTIDLSRENSEGQRLRVWLTCDGLKKAEALLTEDNSVVFPLGSDDAWAGSVRIECKPHPGTDAGLHQRRRQPF